MLAKRIIPCLDVKGGRVVKGAHFINLRDAGDPVELGGFYDQEGADELVFLDITASAECRKTMIDLAKRVAESVYIPFIVGGGISDIDDFRAILLAGADKVSINTAAVKTPQLIREVAQKFGSQCVVVAIDAKRIYGLQAKGEQLSWEVYIYGGRIPTGKDAIKWAKEVEELGAGEILLTSMDRDGTQAGYDLELTRAVAESVNIPVIASGGAGTLEHIYQALTQGGAQAALIASMVHYKKYSIKQIKEYLKEAGVTVRL